MARPLQKLRSSLDVKLDAHDLPFIDRSMDVRVNAIVFIESELCAREGKSMMVSIERLKASLSSKVERQ